MNIALPTYGLEKVNKVINSDIQHFFVPVNILKTIMNSKWLWEILFKMEEYHEESKSNAGKRRHM